MAHIHFEQQGPVGRLQLNRPEKRNAQTLQMWRELAELGQQLTGSPGELRVIVVCGAGGCFSSGIDTTVFATGELLRGQVDGREVQSAFSWLRSDRFLTIAAIEKFAIGAGLELALWCDLRLASEGTVLALPEGEFGIIPDLGGCSLLPEIVGYARAIELITTARKIEAQEALRWGLLNEVVPPAELEARVEAIVAVLLVL
ncbi:MAG TPA: enoyl-CoA hydratase/isomerase family protein, partial [Gemmatales bacterium]|nr:enoyl-CoA hydratase/isomerase family protein [Gemmatales bacterium]